MGCHVGRCWIVSLFKRREIQRTLTGKLCIYLLDWCSHILCVVCRFCNCNSHYLCACMKSKFNFFYYKPANRYVAIDNDRCFTPEAVINSPRAVEDKMNRITVWKNLTYELACHLPSKLQQLLLSTTTTTTSVNTDRGDDGHVSSLLSNRLIEALKGDVLGDQLIASQPEAFEELDRRVYELATHIKRNCIVSNKTITT